MKKGKAYLWVMIAFGLAITGIVIKYFYDQRKETVYYALQQRTGPLATSAEWIKTRNNAESLLINVRNKNDDIKSMLALAALFIREARITGNHAYYDMAALQYVNKVLSIDSVNFEALLYKSLIELSQHHFSEGLQTAERARKINPYNAFVYGILVDGNVEMGYYDSAVANSDRMVSIRPDIRSYSRISYLREIHGDYPGAIEAMKMAIESGVPGDEATEWARIQLGHLYENTGDIENAATQYTTALDVRPGYAYALGGLGRVARARQAYKDAIVYFLRADSSISDYSFKEELAMTYQLAGEQKKAKEILQKAVADMLKDARSADADESMGHYADRELAYVYLKLKEVDKALDHALREYNRRPENIDVNEAVAWTYYHKNNYTKALEHINTALKTNSKNPVLLCRAGLIYYKTGARDKGKNFIREALKHNPNIDEMLKSEAGKILQTQ